jgi:hypothetical protein
LEDHAEIEKEKQHYQIQGGSMKPLNKKQSKAIRDFITDHARQQPIVPDEWIMTESARLRHNMQVHIRNANASHKQREDMHAELLKVQAVLRGVKFNTKEFIRACVPAGMYARNATTGGVVRPANDTEPLLAAVCIALDSMPKDKPRGKGHATELRRQFVRYAARLAVGAGIDPLGVNPECVFSQWLDFLDDTLGLGLCPYRETFRAPIVDVIGKTATARKKYAHELSENISNYQRLSAAKADPEKMHI